jgi:hypothetical protein
MQGVGWHSLGMDAEIFAPCGVFVRFGPKCIYREIRMKTILLATGLAAFALAGAMAPGAHAANADNPYGNVDHSNDAGNDTGDSRVEGLNSRQLDGNYKGTYQVHPQGGPTMNVPPPPPRMNQPPPPPPPPPPATIVR